MTKKFIAKLIGFGILTWLIPFLGSFPFYSPEQGLLIDIFLFKTIMIVLGGLVATIFLVLIFKNITKDYLKAGLIIGLVWLLINWGLDLLILLPMADMPIGQYFTEIGLRYLVLPIYTLGIAYLLAKK
ncbi:hypothetical protein ACFL2U_01395 [Patescibacteria group bacterium]